MKSLFIAPPVGGGQSRNLNDPPLVALRLRRCSSECAVAPLEIGIRAIQLSPYHAGLAGRHLQRLPVSTAGDWDSGNAAFALSRGSCGTTPSASSSDPRFSDMLFSPPAFRHQVNRMTQEQPSGLLLTASGIQHRVPRRTDFHPPAPPRSRLAACHPQICTMTRGTGRG